ncbi:MAG: PfkB family carbohydrate kinase [Anaerolineae bacterium]|nr:PfkB family carbohydrate kinase [Anaerolineae bacterium]
MIRYTNSIDPIDYLVIGHVTQDVVENGFSLGGTVSFAALTAKALGLRVGVLTSCTPDMDLSLLQDVTVAAVHSDHNTTFKNIYTPSGRIQYLNHQATVLDAGMVPETWRNAPIVHLGPVAQEIDPNIVRAFPESFIGVTPQGWMRAWDAEGRVRFTDWLEARFVLENISAVVLSIEDVEKDYKRVEDMLSSVRVLALTEGSDGAQIYWNGDVRHVRPPRVYEGDATGAGDIFAASFFYRLQNTRDPWEAARFATQLASLSVTRKGLAGVPTAQEVKNEMTEVLWKP